uniref:PDZ domain-containing protein n=1 Tax=Eucampia antarctica TaxID=49252 RepID=A0A7S2S7F1_9STRA|mmetsp:Transcript_4064/g.3845  ORF Transcript_4064/g.3845 Transcript_4064/m.3845 type:complete len:373 (+) Transcript_4064:25-1143(+)|eukprot:CAMPEP_0197825474 /NCGR_PEP_ID=MMETSP1437-20131217/2553_1 /TAXON_ID=49252 ORGANISM="Eucampia antarctica, Strain CCMP1452" /NCGR_SAMPLE_ID=MMETSP1437 /ASSEMBLY_ACC=CAM_ASM_001096 /LENGTH=372 /DNA_ID=CAMNT_0043425481 /DNA_START=61 /DNA_END=1176 /DNA_ORIENTATION=-
MKVSGCFGNRAGIVITTTMLAVHGWIAMEMSEAAFLSSSSSSTSSSSWLSSPIVFKGKEEQLSLSFVGLKAVSNDRYYAAAGASVVDMNRYNVPLEQAADEWKAVLQAESSMQAEGIFLSVHNAKKDLFVDTLSFDIDRSNGGGLGIALLELAGGRDDGLGITIVDELVDGGNAQRDSEFLPGDSIVQLSTTIITKVSNKASSSSSSSMEEEENVVAVSTECLGYDATVEAIGSLPLYTLSDIVTVTVKRVRRQPKITVQLQYPPSQEEPDVTVELFAGENLRRALLTRGVKLNDALSRRFDSGGMGDCGAEGTCATCVVDIAKGLDLLNPKKQQEDQILLNHPKRRMACKAIVGYGMTEGDMTIQVNPRQW